MDSQLSYQEGAWKAGSGAGEIKGDNRLRSGRKLYHSLGAGERRAMVQEQAKPPSSVTSSIP